MTIVPDGTLKPITSQVQEVKSVVLILPSTSKNAGRTGPFYRPVFLKAKENKPESSSDQSDDETDKKIIHFSDLIIKRGRKNLDEDVKTLRSNEKLRMSEKYKDKRRSNQDSPYIPNYRKKYGITPRRHNNCNYNGLNPVRKNFSNKPIFNGGHNAKKNCNNKTQEDICPWIEPEKLYQITNSYKLPMQHQVPNTIFLQQPLYGESLQFVNLQTQQQLQAMHSQESSRFMLPPEQSSSVVPSSQQPYRLMIPPHQQPSRLMPPQQAPRIMPPPQNNRTGSSKAKTGILGTTPYSPVPESFINYQQIASGSKSFHFSPSPTKSNNARSRTSWPNRIPVNNHQGYRNYQNKHHWHDQQNYHGTVHMNRNRDFRQRPYRFHGRGGRGNQERFSYHQSNQKSNYEWRSMTQ